MMDRVLPGFPIDHRCRDALFSFGTSYFFFMKYRQKNDESLKICQIVMFYKKVTNKGYQEPPPPPPPPPPENPPPPEKPLPPEPLLGGVAASLIEDEKLCILCIFP